MQIIDDIKTGYKCEYLLEQTSKYKKQSDNDDTYFLTYLTQYKRYRELKETIKNEHIKTILSELEKKLLTNEE